MSASKIRRIGILAPKAYRQVLGLTNVRRSFQRSFPDASIFYLEEADLKSMARLETCDAVVLPPSFDGEDTPYRHYLNGKAADNLIEYAQFGRIASFCSGTWAILERFSYTFKDGIAQEFNGYAPLLPVTASGPLGGSAEMRVVPIFMRSAEKDNLISLCYDGGPVINPVGDDMSDIRQLAFFENGAISALAAKKPNGGIVVAFSALADIHACDVPEQEAYADIRRPLMQTRGGHDALWKRAMAILETRILDHP